MKQEGTRRVRSRIGAVMLEFVLAFPVILTRVFGVIQIAHIWVARLGFTMLRSAGRWCLEKTRCVLSDCNHVNGVNIVSYIT